MSQPRPRIDQPSLRILQTVALYPELDLAVTMFLEMQLDDTGRDDAADFFFVQLTVNS